MPEKRLIKFFRVAMMLSVSLLLAKAAECADYLPEAPVDNGFRSLAYDDVDPAARQNWRWHLHSNAYNDYDPYLVYDYANFDCPAHDYRINGRTIPRYRDDFPMHETYGYRVKRSRCSDLYYPYNYPVPR